MFEDHSRSSKQQLQINRTLRVIVLQFLVIASIGQAVLAKAPAPTPEQACRAFVQKFYNQYGDRERRAKPGAPDPPTKYGSDYSPKLRRELQEDADAQAKVPGEIVGLDFDPILSTNAEPYQKYVVEKVTKKGQSYWADIYGINGKTKTSTPVVTPELVQINWRWQFINFHYGKTKFAVNENLLSVLKQLRRDRLKYAKEPK